MLDATTLGIFDFDVIIVSDVILERPHLDDTGSERIAKLNCQELHSQIHVLEKFEMQQLRQLGSDV